MYWLVLYQTNTGFVYGWVCKAPRPADAEAEFWRSMIMPETRTVKCIAQVPQGILDAYFALYEEKPGDE